MNKLNLALNNLQWLIYCKTNQFFRKNNFKVNMNSEKQPKK